MKILLIRVICVICVKSGVEAVLVRGLEEGLLPSLPKILLSSCGDPATNAGVKYPGLFHAWGKQIIGGIGWELVQKVVELNGDEMPDFEDPTVEHWRTSVPVPPLLYVLLAEEMCVEAGVELRYFETPCQMEWLTDPKIVEERGNWKVTTAVQGEFRTIYCFLTRPRPAGNRNYVYHADNSSGKLRTETNVAGRASILRSLRFVKTLPGGENARLVTVSNETGVRETFHVQGKYVMTIDDYRTGRVFEDSVCYAYYPIDIHRPNGVRPQQLERGTVPTIPYRSLIVENVPHFFVAGRCVSCDRETGSALRVQSICMATGQAAGMAAALAAKNRVRPEGVKIEELKSELKKQGAIVPQI